MSSKRSTVSSSASWPEALFAESARISMRLTQDGFYALATGEIPSCNNSGLR